MPQLVGPSSRAHMGDTAEIRRLSIEFILLSRGVMAKAEVSAICCGGEPLSPQPPRPDHGQTWTGQIDEYMYMFPVLEEIQTSSPLRMRGPWFIAGVRY